LTEEMGKSPVPCPYCEQPKQPTKHPGYVFLARSNDYTRIARSRHPGKAVEEYKGTKGFIKAKGFPRPVQRSAWKLEFAFGPFVNDKLARQFKMAWVRGDVKKCHELLSKNTSVEQPIHCYKFQ
jgi:hypothetical protein